MNIADILAGVPIPMVGLGVLALEFAILVPVALAFERRHFRKTAAEKAARLAAEQPLTAVETMLRDIKSGAVEIMHAEYDSPMEAGGEMTIGFKFRLRVHGERKTPFPVLNNPGLPRPALSE